MGGGGVTSNNIDTSALQAKITEAQGLYDTTPVSTQSGTDVPLGTLWVTQQAKTSFQTAISTAANVLSNPVSQAAVNSETATLTNQIEQFKNARQSGTASPVNKTALNAKIAEAEKEKSSVVVATSSANVASGRQWVTQSNMTNFEAAITTASNALTTATTQTAVDNAVSALNKAITVFKNSRQNGTKTSGFTQADLAALITTANAAKAGVQTNTNGDNVSPSVYWVYQYLLDIFNNAISTAQAATGNIDSAYIALVTAINTFNSGKALGSIPDKNALFNAIRTADITKYGIVVAANAAQAPYGSGWATEQQWSPFNTAYYNALNSVGDYNATKNQVAELTSALTTATSAFIFALNSNGTGTKRNSITINGLNSFNNKYIQLGLFASADIANERPQIYGEGLIQNNTVTVYPYDYSNNFWIGNGLWYVGFMIEDEPPQTYISNSAFNFTAAPNQITSFSDYKKSALPNIGGETEYTDVVYSEDGSRVTVYLDGVGVPLMPSQRATDSAKIAYDYLEAVFISGSTIARAQWELGQSAGISGVAKGASGIGIDYAWEADKTAANTIALIAVGRKDGKTLIGIGNIKDVDGVTNTKIYPETKSVTFYIETIKKGLVAAGDSPASAYDSFDFVSSGSTIPEWTRDGHSARFPIGNSSYPMYFLPETKNAIQLAEYKFFGSAVTFAQQIRLSRTATPYVNIVERIPRYMDGGRYLVPKSSIIDTETTITLGTYTNTAESSLNPVIPLVFTTKGTGIVSFYIEIPVYILTSANDTNTGSLPPVAWRIRTGIGSELYSLDNGKGGNGGCVFMGVGVTNLDDVEWSPIPN